MTCTSSALVKLKGCSRSKNKQHNALVNQVHRICRTNIQHKMLVNSSATCIQGLQ
jgi:hypothetical protein